MPLPWHMFVSGLLVMASAIAPFALAAEGTATRPDKPATAAPETLPQLLQRNDLRLSAEHADAPTEYLVALLGFWNKSETLVARSGDRVSLLLVPPSLGAPHLFATNDLAAIVSYQHPGTLKVVKLSPRFVFSGNVQKQTLDVDVGVAATPQVDIDFATYLGSFQNRVTSVVPNPSKGTIVLGTPEGRTLVEFAAPGAAFPLKGILETTHDQPPKIKGSVIVMLGPPPKSLFAVTRESLRNAVGDVQEIGVDEATAEFRAMAAGTNAGDPRIRTTAAALGTLFGDMQPATQSAR